MALGPVLFVALIILTRTPITRSLESESEETFDFEEWINECGLSEVKPLFEEYNATTLDVLTVRSPEIDQLISDPRLCGKDHLTAAIMKALAPNVAFVVVSEEENQVKTKIVEHLQTLTSLKHKVEELTVQYPESKNSVDEQNVKQKARTRIEINEIFDQMIEQMERRRNRLLGDLDFSEREEQNVNVTLKNAAETIQSLTKFLELQQQSYERRIRTHPDEDRENRKQEILKMGYRINDNYDKRKESLQGSLSEVEQKIERNNKYKPELRFVIDDEVYSNMLEHIKQFGTVDTHRKESGAMHTEKQQRVRREGAGQEGGKQDWTSTSVGDPFFRFGVFMFAGFGVLSTASIVFMYVVSQHL